MRHRVAPRRPDHDVYAAPPPAPRDELADALKRRAHRLADKGELRKAAITLRELVARTDAAAHWVMLGHMLRRARRLDDALAAFREGLWRHRQAGAFGRARSVAQLVLTLDPLDPLGRRVMSQRSALRLAA